MGVKNLWSIIKPMASTHDYREYAYEHGFVQKYHNSRVFHIGIDASVMLDGFHAADKAVGQLHASDTTLTQLFRFLCQLSGSPTDCTFVYDGDERPFVKRGRNVIKRVPAHYAASKVLVKKFGYRVHIAKGEADAELAIMNKLGVIDAVLTKDSDAFPFGAKCVMRVDPDKSTAAKLVVVVFHAQAIQEHMKISWGGFVLIALLLGNDTDEGVHGIGPKTALGLVKCGFGDDLLHIYNNFSTMPHQLRKSFDQLRHDIANEIQFNRRSHLGKCNPALARQFMDSQFPSLQASRALKGFADPATYFSGSSGHPNIQRMLNLPDLKGVTEFCIQHFAWTPEHTLQKFHSGVWTGLVIRMLCSRYLLYNSVTAKLAVPLMENHFEQDEQGDILKFVETQIKSQNPPNLKGKRICDTAQVTFCVEHFIGLTGLLASNTNQRKTVKVTLPVPIIAAATGQVADVAGLRELLANSGPRPPPKFVVHVDVIPNTTGESSGSGSNSGNNTGPKRKHVATLVQAEVKRSRTSVDIDLTADKGIDLGVIDLSDDE